MSLEADQFMLKNHPHVLQSELFVINEALRTNHMKYNGATATTTAANID